MKNGDGNLSPRERIEAALKLHQVESPGSPISIVAICAQARVSRANLYERHDDLVKKMQGKFKSGKRVDTTATLPVAELKRMLAAEKKRALALRYLCVELQAEIHRLRARMELDATQPARRHRR